MKKHLTLFFICLMALSVSVQAQHRPHHSGKSKQAIEKLATELNLSDEQVNQMESMSESLMKEMMETKKSDLSREEIHAKMKELREKKEGMMKEILSSEQFEKMEQLHKDRKGKGKGKHFNKEEMKKKHEEMKKFMQEEVKPFMTSKRAELDKMMKRKDRKQVNKLRDLAEDQREVMKAEMAAKKEAFKKRMESDEFEGKDKKPHHFKKRRGKKGHHMQKMHLMKFMKENEAEFEKAKEYATKYADEIDELMSEIDAQKKIWHEEKGGDFKKGKKGKKGKRHMKDGAKACPEGKAGCSTEGDETSRRKRPDMDVDRETMKRIGFLLMPSEFKAEEEISNREVVVSESLEAKVFPNPSQNSNVLELNIEEKGKYLIELYNENGQKVKVVNNSKLEQGVQKFEVDLSNLPSGVYYYTISNGKDRSTQKFVKN